MKFTVEQWAPEYGTPTGAELEETTTVPEVDIEVPSRRWAPITPSGTTVESVLFVDGVRRVDANVWISQPDGTADLGLCATYAAGAVHCDGRAELVAAEVRRGLFTAAPGASPIVTRHAAYEVRGVTGSTPEELWLGIQQRMGETEQAIAARHSGEALVVVDGPLSGPQVPNAVGYVKTHHVHYLPPALRPVIGDLVAGQRTPLFLTTTAWSRYSWYLRLPGPAEHPWASVVRCEVAADLEVAKAKELADRVTLTLPRFASHGHKDPRAPQNLYPIGGLERALRRRLGDQSLLYRSLRAAAA
jgi:hypothetical protein